MRTLALLTLLPLTACANYDFARARLPNGGYDHGKLIADLKESGEGSLVDITWVPLIYTKITSFRASEPAYPEGYTLSSFGGVGPLFCIGWSMEHVVTENAGFVESEDDLWAGWTLLYRGHESRIATPYGDRLSERHRVAVLFGTRDDHALYLDGKFLEKVEKQERDDAARQQRTTPTAEPTATPQ
jgi:hypothetical protein